MSAYRGTLLSGALFVALLSGAWWLLQDEDVPVVAPPALLRFEKDDLIGFRIERQDETIEVRLDDAGQWQLLGRDWRPRQSMIRRVAHQLHDLDARAVVATAPESLEPYGLGASAIHVQIDLRGGQQLRFDAGAPNPTAVSHYVRPLPGDTVYIVKKSALDYYGWDIQAFREDRFAWMKAEEAVRIDATVDGRRLVLERTGPRSWSMREPVEQLVERSQVRMMLGRTAALSASRIEDSTPQLRQQRGLESPSAQVQIEAGDGRRVVVWVGEPIAHTEPAEAWMATGPSGALYAARSGFLEAFRLPLEQYRRVSLLPELGVGQLHSMELQIGSTSLMLRRDAGSWYWADGRPAASSTPSRLASLACGLQAQRFVTAAEAERAGLQQPSAVLTLVDQDLQRTTLVLGSTVVQEAEGQPRYLRIEGQSDIVVVGEALSDAIFDLQSEAQRHSVTPSEQAPAAPSK